MDIRKVTLNDPLYPQVWNLREEVLRKPLGQSLRNDDMSNEGNEIILAGLEEGTVQGCVMLRPLSNGWVKLRQMAVAPERQGSGLGRQLVEAAERCAWEQGFKGIELNARLYAAGFYSRLGYVQEGAEFSEVGIPHIRMIKQSPA